MAVFQVCRKFKKEMLLLAVRGIRYKDITWSVKAVLINKYGRDYSKDSQRPEN